MNLVGISPRMIFPKIVSPPGSAVWALSTSEDIVLLITMTRLDWKSEGQRLGSENSWLCEGWEIEGIERIEPSLGKTVVPESDLLMVKNVTLDGRNNWPTLQDVNISNQHDRSNPLSIASAIADGGRFYVNLELVWYFTRRPSRFVL